MWMRRQDEVAGRIPRRDRVVDLPTTAIRIRRMPFAPPGRPRRARRARSGWSPCHCACRPAVDRWRSVPRLAAAAGVEDYEQVRRRVFARPPAVNAKVRGVQRCYDRRDGLVQGHASYLPEVRREAMSRVPALASRRSARSNLLTVAGRAPGSVAGDWVGARPSASLRRPGSG